MLGVNSRAERELCNTLCMCRLTLVGILANFYKATGMQTHLPSLWLEPSCHADSPLCYGVDCLCPCPVANSLSAPLSNQLSSRVPLPLPATPRFQFQNPLSRAKTDKGIVCLAGHLHSVTLVLPRIYKFVHILEINGTGFWRTPFIEYNQTVVLCLIYYHQENLFSCLTKYTL